MNAFHRVAALALAGAAAPAIAGPPYLTDDPVPTDTGHWEIYAFTAGEGHRSTLDEAAGFDLNYGPVKGVQLTATLPLSFSHAPLEGWRSGTGDVELGVKYRFFHDEKNGVSAAIFPRAILATAAHSPGEKTRFLLPLWVGKDFAGGTSVFGGGGFTINPGAGNRDFWQAGVAATQDLTKKTIDRRRDHPARFRHAGWNYSDPSRCRLDHSAVGPLRLALLGRANLGRSSHQLSILRRAGPQLLRSDHQHAETARNGLRPLGTNGCS